MKSIVTLIALSLSMSTLANSNGSANFGSLDQATLLSLHEERVHNLVSDSSEFRRNLEKGRYLAGSSEEDRKWANEFEELMNNENDVDYLKKALEL